MGITLTKVLIFLTFNAMIFYAVGYKVFIKCFNNFRHFNTIIGIKFISKTKCERLNIVKQGIWNWDWITKPESNRSDRIGFKVYRGIIKKQSLECGRDDYEEWETNEGKRVVLFGLDNRNLMQATKLKTKQDMLNTLLIKYSVLEQNYKSLLVNMDDKVKETIKNGKDAMMFVSSDKSKGNKK